MFSIVLLSKYCKNMNTNEDKTLETLMAMLDTVEKEVRKIKLVITKHQKGESIENLSDDELKEMSSKLLNYTEDDNVSVVEWVYDWVFMVGSDGKKYPVPLNYSSKSKLISQDLLKLRILPDGKLIYKLIGPAPRSYIKATVSKWEDNKYIGVGDDGQKYYLNAAAVSFFKATVWDEISLVINAEGKGNYAAIETKL